MSATPNTNPPVENSWISSAGSRSLILVLCGYLVGITASHVCSPGMEACALAAAAIGLISHVMLVTQSRRRQVADARLAVQKATVRLERRVSNACRPSIRLRRLHAACPRPHEQYITVVRSPLRGAGRFTAPDFSAEPNRSRSRPKLPTPASPHSQNDDIDHNRSAKPLLGLPVSGLLAGGGDPANRRPHRSPPRPAGRRRGDTSPVLVTVNGTPITERQAALYRLIHRIPDDRSPEARRKVDDRLVENELMPNSWSTAGPSRMLSV